MADFFFSPFLRQSPSEYAVWCPMNSEVFFSPAGGNRNYFLVLDDLWGLFPLIFLGDYSHTRTETEAAPLQILGSFLCKALYSPILCPVNSSSLPLDSQLHLLNSWKARGNFWILFSCAMLETPSSQWARAIVGLTSLVSHPSEITVLCCLISTVLKTIVSDSYLYLYLKSPIF